MANSPDNTPQGVYDDKALNKCATQARKYFLLSLSEVPADEQVDADLGVNDAPPARRSATVMPSPKAALKQQLRQSARREERAALRHADYAERQLEEKIKTSRPSREGFVHPVQHADDFNQNYADWRGPEPPAHRDDSIPPFLDRDRTRRPQ
jgi:hypothetical protein